MKILWIPHTDWCIPQRAQTFCHVLSERHEVHVTDWARHVGTLRDLLNGRLVGSLLPRRNRDGRITVHGVPRVPLALHTPPLRRLNTAIFSSVVRSIIKRQRIDVVVGSFLVPPPHAPRVIFDLFDENVAAWRRPETTAYADEIEAVERAYLEQADAVVAASTVLVDKARRVGTNGPIHHIPNGVHLDQFAVTTSNTARECIGVRSKVVGTVGNHESSAELDKVLEAAEVMAESNVTFLIAGRGGAVAGAQRRATQAGLRNVRFSGFVPPSQVANVISGLDVGLCTYNKSPMDDARSPMRLLLYAAAGIPAVCTNLEEVRRMALPNVVLIPDTPGALAEGIRTALERPRGRPPQIESYDLPQLVNHYEAVLGGRSWTSKI